MTTATATTATTRPLPRIRRGSSLAGKAYWAMVRRVALIAAGIDVAYIGLFSWLGSFPLAAVNLIGIAMYLGAYALIGRRRNAAGLTLIWAEVLLHAALGSLLIGWDSGFHYYLLLFIPAIVIANSRGYAIPIVLALLAYFLGLKTLCDHLGPLTPLSGTGLKVVFWTHICLVFAMSSAIAGFYRRTIVIAELRLFKQATSDPLTGLHNRGYFHALAANELARSQRSGEPIALLLCDIDHFKQVNDRHGHEMGDRVLVHVAQVLSANLRGIDVLARWGGEEFLALMPACTLATAEVVAERIRAAVEATELDFAGQAVKITMSLGVTQVRNADDLQAATVRSDQALYQSKNTGRNRVSVLVPQAG